MLFKREQIQFTCQVHQGTRGADCIEIKRLSEYAAFPIRHYWADTFAQMFEKHRRYLSKEGEARYARRSALQPPGNDL